VTLRGDETKRTARCLVADRRDRDSALPRAFGFEPLHGQRHAGLGRAERLRRLREAGELGDAGEDGHAVEQVHRRLRVDCPSMVNSLSIAG